MKTIEITNAIARKPEWSMAEPVNFAMEEGEHIAIIGRNGSGKSMFVDMLTGRHPAFPGMVRYGFEEPYDKLKYITFRDTYGGDNDRTYFLQQRWNQMEIDEETPTVGQKLEEAYQLAGEDTPSRRALQRHIYELFQMEGLLDKYIILLSSGELRKYKLAASLFTNPRVLIMDNPFIGLDAQTRTQLKDLLEMLAKEQGLQIILVLAKTDEIPEFITHIVEVKEMRVMPKVSRRESSWRVEGGGWSENTQVRILPQTHLPPHSTLHTPRNNSTLHPPRRSSPRDNHTIQPRDHPLWRTDDTKGPGLDGKARRALVALGSERVGQVYPTLAGLCRQSPELCLRHLFIRTQARLGREHLGHQEAYRLCVARDAPQL